MKVVVFRISGQDYAADIRDVQEVIRSPSVTPLPHPTPPLVGVFNLRGRIVTALDGKALLGLPPSPAVPARAVVLQTKGRTVGLLVDAANQVVTVDEQDMRPIPEEQGLHAARAVILHEGSPIVLLDTPSLLDERQDIEARSSP